jgi:glyoxylase-like metal-dependent hydrolase (beta-lactamase superfamily II)
MDVGTIRRGDGADRVVRRRQGRPCRLFGGQLPVGLRALGVERDEVTDVVGTHLHPDHVGWLFDLESRPSFPRASIWFGAGDWRFFDEGRHTPCIQDHVQQGCRACGRSTWTPPSPGITAVQTRGTHLATCSRAAGSAGGRDGRPGAHPETVVSLYSRA